MARERSTEDVHFRARRKELGAWKAAADRDDLSLSEWIRKQLNRGVTPAPVVDGESPQ